MAKAKNSIIGYLYVIGMALTAVGFLMPIFSAFGGHLTVNGFDLVGKGNSIMKIAALLVFIGAVAGVVLQFVSIKKANLYKLIALVVTIVAGLYCFFNTSDVGVKIAGKFLAPGFYMIIIGWCAAVVGWVLNKD